MAGTRCAPPVHQTAHVVLTPDACIACQRAVVPLLLPSESAHAVLPANSTASALPFLTSLLLLLRSRPREYPDP
ncbi:hypothetical protein EON66_05710 [archaeon]|nr:MAG: hypothetical protein EON66_05710 [archaeon]